MSRAEIRNVAVLAAWVALAAPPALAAESTTTLRVSAARRGAQVTVDGRLRPSTAGRRVVVQVRKGGKTLARIAGPLHRDGTFSTRVELLADPGALRVTVTCGRLRVSRALA